jgi:hypothetical protein
MRIARQRELRLERGFVELGLLLEVEGVAGQEAGRGQAHQRGRGRHQHHIDLAALLDAPQRGQPFGDQILVGRERVVGQGFPIGKHGDAQLGREELQLAFEPLRVGRLRRDDGCQSALRLLRLREARQQQGVG